MARLTIYVREDLLSRINKVRKDLEISAVCSEALARAAETHVAPKPEAVAQDRFVEELRWLGVRHANPWIEVEFDDSGACFVKFQVGVTPEAAARIVAIGQRGVFQGSTQRMAKA